MLQIAWKIDCMRHSLEPCIFGVDIGYFEHRNAFAMECISRTISTNLSNRHASGTLPRYMETVRNAEYITATLMNKVVLYLALAVHIKTTDL